LLTADASRAAAVVSEQFEWQENSGSKPIGFGGVTVRVLRRANPAKIAVQVSGRDARRTVFVSRNAWGLGATVQFAELDRGNRYPEILFSTFSGGAHCCFETMVLTHNGKKWVSAPERGADGAAPEAQDIDGDGLAEVMEPGGAFLLGR